MPATIVHPYGPRRPGTEIKILGIGSYGKVTLIESDFNRSITWATKSGYYLSPQTPRKSLMCADFLLLRRARDEHAEKFLQALAIPPNWVAQALPHVDRHQIDFDIQLATCGDLRNYTKENPLLVESEMFVLWLGGQVLSGLAWLQAQKSLHGDIMLDNLLVFQVQPHHTFRSGIWFLCPARRFGTGEAVYHYIHHRSTRDVGSRSARDGCSNYDRGHLLLVCCD